MPLIRLKEISIAFGVYALLDKAEFQIKAGERIGLIGRNGEGKSTLLRIISDTQQIDSGEVWRKPGLRCSILEQTPQMPKGAVVYDAVADGLGGVGHWLAQYHHFSTQIEGAGQEEALKKMGQLQHQLETHDGWSLQQRVETIITRLDLPFDAPVESLSGGWQRRVDLARALVNEPELLLLDEPTNHLDLETISWLEDKLAGFSGALLFVTHDRDFLQKLATRIIDLDRGKLTSWPGGYKDFLQKKSAALEEEENQNALFDKKLAQEETWIRQGIKARRTRNEGRVRALEKLRKERAGRRQLQGTAKLELTAGDSSGKIVIEAKEVNFSYPGKQVVSHFSTTILRGDRIGLMGPNGVGKSTLLQLLLKKLQPDSGTIRHGTKLEIAYFDQQRAKLDPEKSVVDSIAGGNEYVEINGFRRHVMSYLSDFLFAPARARSPIKSLSGGEKSRVLLAQLFSRPANLLVMDEPTNDLDLETLELLEDMLVNFDGTLLLVSHDRTFMDNVITSVFSFEGQGQVDEYVGGYRDWLRQRPSETATKTDSKLVKQKAKVSRRKKDLNYKERRELEGLPALIETLETRQAEVNDSISSADFYQKDKETIAGTLEELKKLEASLEEYYARWDELEARAEELGD